MVLSRGFIVILATGDSNNSSSRWDIFVPIQKRCSYQLDSIERRVNVDVRSNAQDGLLAGAQRTAQRQLPLIPLPQSVDE